MGYIQRRLMQYYSDILPSELMGSASEDLKENKKNSYEVSVIIVTYNPVWEKLIATLKSIIIQRNILLQVVISDDGSRENYFRELKDYFDKISFQNYIMISNSENQGTVINVLRGVQAATGKYVKTISPGDCLTDENVLSSWVEELVIKNIDWSFSDAIYYKIEKGNIDIVQEKAYPANIRPYVRNKTEKCRWNYCVLDDIALGAAIMVKKQVIEKYLRRIVGKVRYAEDNIWRLMMFDGLIGSYFPHPAVYYELGSGISTCGNDLWGKRLEEDWNAATEEMVSGVWKNDVFQMKANCALKKLKSKNRLHHIFVNGKIGMYLLKKFAWRKTKMDVISDM